MSKRGRPLSAESSAEEILAKLDAATAEAKDTIRTLHEARRDLKTDWAAMKQWLAQEETVQAFRDARAGMQQWVTEELTRLIQADAKVSLARLNTEVTQLIPMYAKELEQTFHRIAERIIKRHPGVRQSVEVQEYEVPPQLAQELLRTLLLIDDEEGKKKEAT